MHDALYLCVYDPVLASLPLSLSVSLSVSLSLSHPTPFPLHTMQSLLPSSAALKSDKAANSNNNPNNKLHVLELGAGTLPLHVLYTSTYTCPSATHLMRALELGTGSYNAHPHHVHIPRCSVLDPDPTPSPLPRTSTGTGIFTDFLIAHFQV
jgi:hypothetical protein